MPKIAADPIIRLWSRVDKNGPTQPHMTTPCWLWTGATSKGYPHMSVGSKTDGTRRFVKCSRLAYESVYGQIPDGLFACHHCDNPLCVRPDHIFAGTQQQNQRDMWTKGRAPRQGDLTDEQVREARQLRGTMSGAAIARRLGVSYSVVYLMLRGGTYRHVE